MNKSKKKLVVAEPVERQPLSESDAEARGYDAMYRDWENAEMAEWAVESAYCMLRNCKSEAQAKVAAALIASRLR